MLTAKVRPQTAMKPLRHDKELLLEERLPLRPCVGIALFNARGEVWLGRRLPKWADERARPIWQMPQGGIEKGEPPRAAALRELAEETGVRSAEFVAEIPGWLTYELPRELIGIALKGKYRGQRQRWFAMRFTGDDREIDLCARGARRAEFDAWRWAPLAEAPRLIVPFKRALYERIVSELAPLARRMRHG